MDIQMFSPVYITGIYRQKMYFLLQEKLITSGSCGLYSVKNQSCKQVQRLRNKLVIIFEDLFWDNMQKS